MDQTTNPPDDVLPVSNVDGIAWPALPAPNIGTLLSLAYQLERSQWWSTERLTALQLLQLEKLLAHAKNTVPFYADRLKHMEVRPGEMRMDDLRQIPLLRRSDVQNSADALKSGAVPVSHLPFHKISTSGSTGRPLNTLGTIVTGMFTRALTLRWYSWLNRDLNCTMADVGLPLASGRPGRRRWVPGFSTGPWLTLGANEPLERQLRWLSAENPHYIRTFPSNLKALLESCERTGVRFPNLRDVTTWGEVLDPGLRDYCSQVWGVPVFNSYGANEFGYIALQCPDTSDLHIQSETLIVEVLDDQGEPADVGSIGRMVVTDLHNFAMPLIRYELGDYAVMGSDCPCGRGLPIIERVLGRSRNMFVLPSGDRFWPIFSQVLGELQEVIPRLVQAQLVQQSRHEITARMVVSHPLDPSEEAKITSALAEAMRGAFKIRPEYVDEIPRAAGGKFLETICEIEEP